MIKEKSKFVPYDKLSKKEKKKIDEKKRGSWNGVDPVTRVVKSKKIYTRKGRRRDERSFGLDLFYMLMSADAD